MLKQMIEKEQILGMYFQQCKDITLEYDSCQTTKLLFLTDTYGGNLREKITLHFKSIFFLSYRLMIDIQQKTELICLHSLPSCFKDISGFLKLIYSVRHGLI